MDNAKLAPGLYLVGKAAGDFEVITNNSKKTGNPYRMVKGRVLAGRVFVDCTSFLKDGEVPPAMPKDQADVFAAIVPENRANGAMSLNIELKNK